MYESPEPSSRFYSNNNQPRSLKTNFIKSSKKSNNKRGLNLVYALGIVSVLIIVIFLLTRIDKSQKIQQNRQQSSKQQNQTAIKKNQQNLIVAFGLQQLLFENPQIIIDKSQNQKQQSQALISFTLDVQDRANGMKPKQQFDKKTLQNFHKQKLTIIKHEKLTSISKQDNNLLTQVFNIFWKKDHYKNIDDILIQGNKKQWKSNGNVLTVIGKTYFSPKAFQILVQKPVKIFIYGLIIQSTPFTTNKQITKISLGSFYISSQGSNIIQCKYLECYRSYSMITFAMNPIEISYISIYSKKSKQQNDDL